MVSRLIQPSYKTGFAKNASESANPHLWEGLAGAWMPSFGVTGDEVYDLSGYRSNGIFQNGTTWVMGERGYSLSMDSVDDWVACGTNPILELQEMTGLCWINSLDSSTDHMIFGKTDNISTSGFEFAMDVAGGQNPTILQFAYYDGAIRGWYEATITNIQPGIWQQVGYRFRPADAEIDFILNGVIFETIATAAGSTIVYTGDEFDIGMASSNPAFYGFLNDIILYNRILSPQEIQELYIDSSAPFRRKQMPRFFVPIAAEGRIMGALAGHGGLAGIGGLAGRKGGLAG